MRIIDQSDFLDEKGELTFIERIRGTLRYGSSWYIDIQSQETIIQSLEKILDKGYVLIRNHTLPGLEVPIPLILVGPPGVDVIYASGSKGIFLAEGEQWKVMGSNSKRFKPVRPNLINRSLLFAKAIERFIEKSSFSTPPIEPVIIFTDPGTHVDTQRSAVRIVMMDALDRYTSALTRREDTVSVEDVHNIVNMILNPPSMQEDSGTREEMEDEATEATSPGGLYDYETEAQTELALPFFQNISFTPRQWIFLGVLVLLDVIILVFFILYILNTA